MKTISFIKENKKQLFCVLTIKYAFSEKNASENDFKKA